MTQLQPKPVHLAGSSSHGDWLEETFTIPRQADPPLPGGVEHNSAGDAATSHGGAGGFPLAESQEIESNAWALCCGVGDFTPATLAELGDALDTVPGLSAAATLAALVHLRAALSGVDQMADPSELVEVPVGDLLVLVRRCLRGIS